ncbi:hypothetical protein A9G35_03515 [Gilliamella sp. Choc5-1]|nr:hypothetical protein A9G35_03515 [Gilliamella apicola]
MRLTLARPTLKRCSNLFQTNLWQDHKLIAECADNDKFWRSYIYEPDSHRPLAQILGKAGQSEKLKTYWYQNNYLGTPHRLTDSLGDTVYECEYSAYGEITHEHWPQAENNIKPINPLRFQGQYFDEETGLHYNINRYYDPFTGRYITQDPLGILGGLNSYQYAGSDPINWVDPLGLLKIEDSGFEGIAGKGTNGAPQADSAKYFGQERQYWTKDPIEFNGNKVYQRNDLFDPNAVDAKGRTNIQRMELGYAPLDKNRQPINLHHMIQRQDGPIAEVTQSFHQQNKGVIHINPNTIPSGINRRQFNKWRSNYWINRAMILKNRYKL